MSKWIYVNNWTIVGIVESDTIPERGTFANTYDTLTTDDYNLFNVGDAYNLDLIIQHQKANEPPIALPNSIFELSAPDSSIDPANTITYLLNNKLITLTANNGIFK